MASVSPLNDSVLIGCNDFNVYSLKLYPTSDTYSMRRGWVGAGTSR